MTFEDAPQFSPTPSPEDAPLVCPLPVPPVAFFGGQRYHVERVSIEKLEAWKQRHGLRFERAAWCGQYGWMNVYERVE